MSSNTPVKSPRGGLPMVVQIGGAIIIGLIGFAILKRVVALLIWGAVAMLVIGLISRWMGGRR